ncbi:hypothetical protein RHMOL_Rhmol10G0201500 [Rhododendron molle]|uniref:Uncharacterized protein n=1 Tax=Rhododendron molle TaxID=49168 RepID=A0ACC0M4I6_RHOML|nr:hypothetical protein RHMOL_Rhmol10G0201500 [Rhododendron molle]
MGADEVPKSLYEPVKKPYVDEEIPKMYHGQSGNVPKSQGAFRKGLHDNPGAWKRENTEAPKVGSVYIYREINVA